MKRIPLFSERPWLRRVGWTVLSLMVTLALVWALAGPVLKRQLELQGSEWLGRGVHISSVEVELWALRFTLSGLRVDTADGRESQISAGKILVDADWRSVLEWAPVISAVQVQTPRLLLRHWDTGRYDLDDVITRLLDRPSAAQESSQLLRFALYNVALIDGEIDFVDHLRGKEQRHMVRKLNLTVPWLSGLDNNPDALMEPRLTFDLNGSHFDSAALGAPFAKTRKGEATLAIAALDVRPYLSYFPRSLPVQVQTGIVDANLKITFHEEKSPRVGVSGSIRLQQLQLVNPDGTPLLAAASVAAALADVRPLERSVALQWLDIVNPEIDIRRQASGEFIPAIATPAGSETPVSATVADAPGRWKFSLEKLALQGGKVRWKDEALVSPVQISVAQARLNASGLQWPPGPGAARFDGAFVLEPLPATAGPATPVNLEGEAGAAGARAQLTVTGLHLPDFAPYWAAYLQPSIRGRVDAQVQARWADNTLQVTVPRAVAHQLTLVPPENISGDAAPKDVNAIDQLEVLNTTVNVTGRTFSVGRIQLGKPSLRLRRDAGGHWNFSRWLRPGATSASATVPAVAPPWKIQLNELLLDDAGVTVIDQAPEKPVRIVLSSLNSRLTGWDLTGSTPATVSVSAKVRTGRTEFGQVSFHGQGQWNPWTLQGELDASGVPVQALLPYLKLDFPWQVQRAEADFKGNVRYLEMPAGAQFQVTGDAGVNDVRVLTDSGGTGSGQKLPAVAEEELLAWKTLSLQGLDFYSDPAGPARFSVRGIALDDFFARLTITPQGHLQWFELLQPQASTQTEAAKKQPAAIDIGPIRVSRGRVAFSDRFIQPHYSASLSGLEGSLSRFTNRMAVAAPGEADPNGSGLSDLTLRGQVEGSASLEVVGQVSPLARPLVLDVKGLVRDVELSPLSSYAIKYAGYGIERGRMNLDLNYRVTADGELRATNRLVLHQLTFGEEVDASVLKLPLKLAVALLADRQGVIDLDVPISGSINDPQFSVWPVFWKLIGQTMAKAVFSPFSLLAGAESSQGLEAVPFADGSSRISAASQAGLQRVATALLEKPSLDLIISGTAELERERRAMQREWLVARVQANGPDLTDAPVPDYLQRLNQLFREANLRKPRNAQGQTQELSLQEMEGMLMDSSGLTEDAVRELARARAYAVREALKALGVPAERLFIGVEKTQGLPATWQPRADLTLTSR